MPVHEVKTLTIVMRCTEQIGECEYDTGPRVFHLKDSHSVVDIKKWIERQMNSCMDHDIPNGGGDW